MLVAVTLLASCSADVRRTGVGISSRPLDLAVEQNLDEIFSEVDYLFRGDLAAAGSSGDLRVAWPLVDALRFHEGQTKAPELLRALTRLTELEVPDREVAWVEYTNELLRRDVFAPPGYFRWKRAMFVGFHERWAPFFDERAEIDWRHVTWGGVLRDAISALVDPPVVDGRDGAWLPDDDIVFAVEIGSQTRAYPKRVMETHELVNDSIGGRRIALSYCTLCGSVVANFVDDVKGRALELRTSGLLRRSNKLMYDVQTESLFDQFSGKAVTGPMREAGVTLDRAPVSIARWGEWRRAHPETTITAEEIGGRAYGPDPLEGRDAQGPIFPVGHIDGRLPRMTEVYGVVTPEGTAVAFPMEEAHRWLRTGKKIAAFGVELRLRAGGLAARSDRSPESLIGQRAFWFAWSQFHPRSMIWHPA
ncbi:MAG: DUF3179 domain-containing (seleno)protein [Actinomycetota bacterium]